MTDILVKFNSSRFILEPRTQELNTELTKFFKKGKIDVSNIKDFSLLFKNINSVGYFSIILHIVLTGKILYNTQKDITDQRKIISGYLDILEKFCSHSVYGSLEHLNLFISNNLCYYYSYHNESNLQLFKKINKLMIQLCPTLGESKIQRQIVLQSDVIKVGFVSDIIMSLHSVTKDRLGIIKGLYNDPRFEVKIITRLKETDIFFNNFVFNGVNYNSLIYKLNGDLDQNKKQIYDQQFDILVYPEIGMCQKSRWLAFCRLAPIQITTWGHSDTSGLPEIDYYVSSKYFNVPDDQQYFSEKLVLLNSIGTYYYNLTKILDLSDISQIKDQMLKFSQKNNILDPHYYGCLQTYFKLHPDFIDILNQITKKDENAVFVVLINDNHKEVMDFLNKNMLDSSKVMMIETLKYPEYCKLIKACDVILDYYPFGGFNSSMDSFSLGKIVITLPSKFINGCFTRGLYNKMEITQFICDNPQDYVNKATQIMLNTDERCTFEKLILEKSEILFEDKESINEWASFLHHLNN